MKPAARATLILAFVVAVAGVVLLLVAKHWSGYLLLGFAIIIAIAAKLGVGSEIGLRERGLTTAAQVIELRRERGTGKRRNQEWRVARVRYRDHTGELHEDIIDECTDDEAERLQVGKSIPIKYDPDHPSVFVWMDPEFGRGEIE